MEDMILNDLARTAISRRHILGQLGALSTTLLVGGAGCGRKNDRVAIQECSQVTPPLPLGPYYLDHSLLRSDIRDDRAGVPIAYQLLVLNTNCVPVRGSAVEIWHADAAGEYSPGTGGNAEGARWLRGLQLTDSEGSCRFDSIFPGWYNGRVTHVHVRVTNGARTVSTNLFFPHAVEVAVHATESYLWKGPNRTTVEEDVELNGAFQLLSPLTVKVAGRIADGLTAHGTLVVPAS